MKIAPTPFAVASFSLAMLAALGSVFLSDVVLASLAASLVAMLGTAYAHAARIGRLARKDLLSFSWAVEPSRPHERHVLSAGSPLVLHAEFRQAGTTPRFLCELRPMAPPEVSVETGTAVTVPPRGAARVTMHVTPLSAGRHTLPGLRASLRGPLGLFDVPLYFPFPIRLTVAPRPIPPPVSRNVLAGASSRHGNAPLRERGAGLELYELRDMQAGDPFHAIAWKPSARLGRWIVREVEHEVQRTHWILLETSGSMRDARPGARKLDLALGLAASAIERWSAEGSRTGLVIFERRILRWVPPDDRPGHLRRLHSTLLDAVHTVDEDLSSVDDEIIARLVLRHIRLHDGLAPPTGRVRGDLLRVAAALAIEAEPLISREAEHVVASRPESRLLRAFCRRRGLPLPWHPELPAAARIATLSEAFVRIGRHAALPDTLLLLAELEPHHTVEALRRPIALLRRRGARISVPLLPSRTPPPSPTPLNEALRTIYFLEERQRLRQTAQWAIRVGADPWTLPPRMLHTAQRRS